MSSEKMTSYPALQKIFETFDAVIGLEVHCQLATRSKIFSTSANLFGEQPNAHIDPTCLGLPGALPVLNEACVDLAIRLGLATSCTIQPVSVFARKNYFYPDLPKGYQITQYDKPICTEGFIELESGKRIGIERIQLEEDAGKNIHVGTASLVDYNRAGVGLAEIVSHPHISNPEEATEYLKRLHGFIVNLEVSDGDLERGNFRVDANISLKPKGQATLGTRCEVKNVNSFKYLEKAIAYEIQRQFDIISAGGRIVMETRGYDSERNVTVSQRSKEAAHDYRYFPEPDLPPLIVTAERVARVKSLLPELPEQKAARYVKNFQLPEYDAKTIAARKMSSGYFELLVQRLEGKVEPKTVSNFFMTDILRALRWSSEKTGVPIEDLPQVPIPLEHSAQLLELQAKGTLSGRMAKDVFEEMLESGQAPEAIVSAKGLAQVSDDGAIRKIVREVVAAHSAQAKDYLSGKDKLFGFFVGAVMKAGKGQLNPARVNELLKEELQLAKDSLL